MKTLLWAALLGLIAQVAVQATEVAAELNEGTYSVQASFEVATSPKKLLAVLTDYENITQLHPSILESEIISENEGSARIRTVVKDCAFLFCKKILRVEQIRQDGSRGLVAEVIPMLSDLRSGQTVWEFTQSDAVTLVKYQSTLQPKFWIPPFIRSHTVTNKLKGRMTEVIQTLQSLDYDAYKKNESQF